MAPHRRNGGRAMQDRPHLPLTPGPFTAVIARADPQERDGAVSLPELDHLVPQDAS
jgi:uncharacterized RmlC-like cupin family protein